MNTFQNKEAKKYLILMAVFSCLALVVFAVSMAFLETYYKKTENQAVFAMLAAVQEKYPEADLAKLVEALNNERDWNERERQALKEELSRYGIDDSVCFIREMKSAHRLAAAVGAVFFVIVEIVLVSLFVRYLIRRKKNIRLLEDYTERIFRGDYALELSDNSEDELSSLKNQLYKLMILLKEQAELARNQKKALAESVSDISHQLKTPLTSTQILLDNISDHPDMDEKIRRKFIKEISNQINGMSWMIVSMLKLSRLDAGVVEFAQEEISVNQMLCEAAENLEVIAELRQTEIEYPAEEKEMKITGDYKWNREAVQNILKNAIEHSPAGETVRIDLQQNDVYTAITITNKGKALTKEQQKQIFERYYSEAKFDENNFGIGLSLAKAVLERQGGYLSVESEEGRTSFTLKYISCG